MEIGLLRTSLYFNSRPSARGDGRRRCTPQSPRYFNSRPSARGDLLWLSDNVCPANFNSRPSARGDSASPRGYRGTHHFNSRPSARGDGGDAGKETAAGVFQFTPLREGRRQGPLTLNAPMKVFQFTPLREGRQLYGWIKPFLTIFQFTPLREGRRQKICNFCKSFVQPLQISMA